MSFFRGGAVLDGARAAMVRAAVLLAMLALMLLLAYPAWAQTPPAPRLTVTKTDDPTTVNVRDELDYRITVRNTGNATASNVVLTDVLPEGTVFLRVDPVSTDCTTPDAGENGTVTCRLGSIGPGVASQETVTITVRVVRGGVIENTASADGSNTGPAQDGASTPVGPNLRINKRDTPDPVDQEDLLAYTITVVNNQDTPVGSATAPIVVRDQLPIDDVRVVAVRSRDFDCDPFDPSTGRLRCEFDGTPTGELGSDDEASITVIVDPEDAGTLENTAEVRFNRFLIDSDTEATRVEARADNDGGNGGGNNGDGTNNGGSDNNGDGNTASDTDDKDDVIKNTVPDKTLADTGGVSGVAVTVGLLLLTAGSLLRASLRRGV